MKNPARGRSYRARVGIAQHGHCHLRARALEQIHIDDGPRRLVDAVFARVADDAYNRQQAHIAIHVSKFNGVADRVLMRPAIACERFADQGHVRRARGVTLVEHASAEQRNSQHLEISVGRDTEIRFASAFFLIPQRIEAVDGFGNFILRHQHKHSVGKSAGQGQSAGRSYAAHAGNLFEPADQVRKENALG